MKKLTASILALALSIALISCAQAPAVTSETPSEPQETVLTLACIGQYGYEIIDRTVAYFNSLGGDVTVETVRYDDRTMLVTELTSGKMPDLIVGNVSNSFIGYDSKGVFLDLHRYLDAEPDLALLPSAQSALETDGKLYRVAPSFSIATLVGNSDYVGTNEGWTFVEMRQVLADAPPESVLTRGWAKDEAFDLLIGPNLGAFVDWDTGAVSFDSGEFKSMLEFMKTLPDGSMEGLSHNTAGAELVKHAHAGMYSLASVDEQFGGKSVFKGFPNGDGVLGIIYPDYDISITSACKNPDAAWAFIRYALTAKSPADVLPHAGLPIVQSKLQEYLDLEMVHGDEEADKQRDPLTQAQRDEFERFLTFKFRYIGWDDTLLSLVREEALPYFSGSKSVEDACRIIQSRATLYVNEQK
ncbi:MAG: ABC transporter substrate-binding protein [Oscillospiraceae bacterium]|jgi:ABC-type glycerol-3-phosphate transport system substrate-binding protein|nr:ABC transporter substrate-binding protein [Oscillospiraceae bacterium]